METSLKARILCVFVPVFNEAQTVETCLKTVLDNDLVKQVIVVDDHSTDGTREILHTMNDPRLLVLFHDQNLGKGSALKSALPHVEAEHFIIQDADLEYDPREYAKLLTPIIEGRADVVYGSRFVGGGDRRVLRFWHSMGNKILTFVSNCFTNLYMTDMATCYKCFRSEVIKDINLTEKRFGIDPEITAKIARRKLRIVEVGVSYSGRSYDQGKKIRFHDAIRHLYCIIKFRFIR